MSIQYIIFVYTHFGLWSQQILLPTFFRSKIRAEKKWALYVITLLITEFQPREFTLLKSHYTVNSMCI